jgi:hypothetical protein
LLRHPAETLTTCVCPYDPLQPTNPFQRSRIHTHCVTIGTPVYSSITPPRILMLSPLIEGSLGGLPALQAAYIAYISDATPAEPLRGKALSRIFGVFFVGVAAGPTLGSILPVDDGTFQLSIALGVINLLFVLCSCSRVCSRSSAWCLEPTECHLSTTESRKRRAGCLAELGVMYWLLCEAILDSCPPSCRESKGGLFR